MAEAVISFDGTLAAGGAVITFDGTLGFPNAIEPPPVQQRFRVRQVFLEVYINGERVDSVQWARCRFALAEPVASAEFMCPKRHGDYDQRVDISMGTTPGYGAYLRFRGYLRNPAGDLYPASVQHQVVGMLQKAAEYFQGTGVVFGVGNFGLLIPHILGRPVDLADWTTAGMVGTSKEIIEAVLDIAGVEFDPADIEGTNIDYGLPNFMDFRWSSGVPPELQFLPSVSRESALAYIQRYDEIDAEWGGPSNYWVGGFYRTTEGLGGRIYRWRTGGRPASPWLFEFTENYNILAGSRIERQYPLGNRAYVQGFDGGSGQGGWRFLAERNNPYMPQNTVHVAPNSPSSPMISWRSYNGSGLVDPDGNPLTDGSLQFTDVMVAAGLYVPRAPGMVLGQDCETVAEAVLLDANKETPTGQIITAEDAPFTQGVTVLVQGIDEQGSSAPVRLLSGEPFLITSLTIDCGHGTEGEPVFRQTLGVTGGGIDTEVAPPEGDTQPPPYAETDLQEDPPADEDEAA